MLSFNIRATVCADVKQGYHTDTPYTVCTGKIEGNLPNVDGVADLMIYL